MELKTAAGGADTPHRSAGRIAGGILLDILAFGGLICIALVVLALFFKVTIVMFATGSMSPTIPAGSIALVREVPASDVRVGQVVTVDRSPELPITHRVTEITGRAGGAVTFRMKGDANSAADPVAYTETSVRRVLWSMPGAANTIVWLRHPLVLGTITLGASALVTWAFWPRDDRRGRSGGERYRGRRSGGDVPRADRPDVP